VSKISANIKLEDVDRIERRGIGYVYRASLSILDLYDSLKRGLVRYAPRYQRGFSGSTDVLESEYDKLFLINDPILQVDAQRARVMAVKYLQGSSTARTSRGTCATNDDEGHDPYDEEQRTLEITGEITVPDTGHRHLAYFTLGLWSTTPRRSRGRAGGWHPGHRGRHHQGAQGLPPGRGAHLRGCVLPLKVCARATSTTRVQQ
jgi:hypothetical protein